TVVKARWFDIITRSIELSTRSATLASMRQLYLLAEVARLKRHDDIEVRIVAVPDDWIPPQPGPFVKETRKNRAALGERLVDDPTSWRTRSAGQAPLSIVTNPNPQPRRGRLAPVGVADHHHIVCLVSSV